MSIFVKILVSTYMMLSNIKNCSFLSFSHLECPYFYSFRNAIFSRILRELSNLHNFFHPCLFLVMLLLKSIIVSWLGSNFSLQSFQSLVDGFPLPSFVKLSEVDFLFPATAGRAFLSGSWKNLLSIEPTAEVCI